jgi:hypothetical protein
MAAPRWTRYSDRFQTSFRPKACSTWSLYTKTKSKNCGQVHASVTVLNLRSLQKDDVESNCFTSSALAKLSRTSTVDFTDVFLIFGTDTKMVKRIYMYFHFSTMCTL